MDSNLDYMYYLEKRVVKVEEELQWLTWFCQNVDFGPAHGDVMEIMYEQYEQQTGRKVPKDWRVE
jgi:hypothetical protein